jgi:hypothetical protein
VRPGKKAVNGNDGESGDFSHRGRGGRGKGLRLGVGWNRVGIIIIEFASFAHPLPGVGATQSRIDIFSNHPLQM